MMTVVSFLSDDDVKGKFMRWQSDSCEILVNYLMISFSRRKPSSAEFKILSTFSNGPTKKV